MRTLWPADAFWQVFESTGSIWAYLAYRRRGVWAFLTRFSLN
jgi:hypothetical protein